MAYRAYRNHHFLGGKKRGHRWLPCSQQGDMKQVHGHQSPISVGTDTLEKGPLNGASP